MPHPYLDARGPIALAHRGGGSSGLENSFAAFDDAVGLGYRYVETDVRATQDGVLVVFHDPTLDRVTDRDGEVATLPWDDVARARIAGREPIVRLDELFATYPGLRLNIDVKSDAAVGPLIRFLQTTPGAVERTCVASFSDERLGRIRTELGRAVCTSAGPREVTWLRAASVGGPLASRVQFTADCLQVPPRRRGLPLVDRRFVATAHAQGLPVHVWTINRARSMERLLDLGVDGLVTDATRTLRWVLERRGTWPSGR